MIHHTCDRCGAKIDQDDLRYSVRLEIQGIISPLEDHHPEDDRDHLLEIHEILERAEDEESDEISTDIYQRQRHDLCSDCFRIFSKNPLGKKVPIQLGFSDN